MDTSWYQKSLLWELIKVNSSSVSRFDVSYFKLLKIFFLGIAEEFKKLLNRTDLPAIIIKYDTTFNLGHYYTSWLTFRFTEFLDLENKPMPTVGLACLIHDRKLQRCHEYFFSVFKNVIPELAGANNVLICTDEKVGIVNSVIKVWLIVTNDSSIYIFLISHFLGFPRYPKSSLPHPRLEKSESLFEEKWCCVQTRSRKLP